MTAMRFRGPAIATFLQQAEENLALLGAQLEGPGAGAASLRLTAGRGSRRRGPSRGASSDASAAAGAPTPPPPTATLDGAGTNGSQEVHLASDLGKNEKVTGQGIGSRLVEGWLQHCAGGRSELEEALEALTDSEREVREQMDIQARTLLGIDRKVKAFESRLRTASEEASEASVAAANLHGRFDELRGAVNAGSGVGPSSRSLASVSEPGVASAAAAAGTGNSSSSSSKGCTEAGGALAVASLAALAATATEVCACGNAFAVDAVYCRRCGVKRATQGLLALELDELRQHAEARLHEHSEALRQLGAGMACEAVVHQAQETARTMVNKLSWSVQQQMDELDCQIQGRFEQRFAALDAEVCQHAQQVARDLLEEYLQGPALEVRIGALFAALQGRTFGGGLAGALARQQLRPLEEQELDIGVDPLWVRREEFQALEALVLSLRDEVAALRKEADGWCKASAPEQPAACNMTTTSDTVPAVEPHRPSHERQSQGLERPRRPSNHRAAPVGEVSHEVKHSVHKASTPSVGESNQERKQNFLRAAPVAVTEKSLPDRPLLVESTYPSMKMGSVRERVAVFERSKSAPPASATSTKVSSPRKFTKEKKCEVPQLEALGEDHGSAPSEQAGQSTVQALPAQSEPPQTPRTAAAMAVAVQDPVALRASHTPKKPRRPGMSPCGSPASTASVRSTLGAPNLAASAAAGVDTLAADGRLPVSLDADFNRACCESSASSPKSLCSCPAPDSSSASRDGLRAGSGGTASDAAENEAAEAHRILLEGILDGNLDGASSARTNRTEVEEATPSGRSQDASATAGGSATAGAVASSQLWSSVADVLVPVSLQSAHPATAGQHIRAVEALEAAEQDTGADPAAPSHFPAGTSSSGEQQRNLWSSFADAPADSVADAAPASSRRAQDSSAARQEAGGSLDSDMLDITVEVGPEASSSNPEVESAGLGASDLWSSVADVVVHAHLGDVATMAGAAVHAESVHQPGGAAGSNQWSSAADVHPDVAVASASSLAPRTSNADSATDLWSSVADIVTVHGLHHDVAEPVTSRAGPAIQTSPASASATAHASSESNSPCERGLWSSASDTAHMSSASAAETSPSAQVLSGRSDWTQRSHGLQSSTDNRQVGELSKDEDSFEKLPAEEGDDEEEEDTDEEEMEEDEEEDNAVNPLDRDGLSTEGSSPSAAATELRPQTAEVRTQVTMRHFESTQVRTPGGSRTVVETVVDEVEDMEILVVEDSGGCMMNQAGEAVRLSDAYDADLVIEDMEELLAGEGASSHGSRAAASGVQMNTLLQDDHTTASTVFSPPQRSLAGGFASEPLVADTETVEEAPSMELWDSILTDIQDDVGSMGAGGAGLPLP